MTKNKRSREHVAVNSTCQSFDQRVISPVDEVSLSSTCNQRDNLHRSRTQEGNAAICTMRLISELGRCC